MTATKLSAIFSTIFIVIILCIFLFGSTRNNLSLLDDIDTDSYLNAFPTAFKFKYNQSLINPNIKSPLLKLQRRNADSTIYAIYCSTGYKPIGIGNALAIYWTARATAFFMNYSFIMNNHINNQTTYINTKCNQKEFALFDARPSSKSKHVRLQWTWFLSMEYYQTLFNTFIDAKLNTSQLNMKQLEIANRYNYLWQQYHHKAQAYAVPYAVQLIFLSYNPFFIPIIRNNTRDAFQRYYNFINDPLYDNVLYEVETYNMIVIHLRLGDTLFNTRSRRILLNIKYFKTAFDMIYKRLESSKDCRFYVIAQLDKSNVHVEKDRLALNISNILANFMTEHFRKYISKKWKEYEFEVKIIGNDSADNDYFRMTSAPFLICSPSSFCLEAAMANNLDTKLIVLPSKGPWNDISDLFFKMTDPQKVIKVKYHTFVNVNRYSVPTMHFHQFQDKDDMIKFKQWFVK